MERGNIHVTHIAHSIVFQGEFKDQSRAKRFDNALRFTVKTRFCSVTTSLFKSPLINDHKST